MKHSAVLSVFFLAAFLGNLASVVAERAEVRYLNFTAKNHHGIYLRDLGLEEVELRIDDEPVPVRYFGYRNVETAFVFLIENSPRTARHPFSAPHLGRVNVVDQIRYHLMDGFFAPVVETGRVLLAEFYRDVEVLYDFTEHAFELELALQSMSPNFSGIERERIPVGRFLGRGVDWLRDRPERRKVIVMFTTTVDRDSYHALDEYRSMLELVDIDLYVVSFAPRFGSAVGGDFYQQVNTRFFRELVAATGGRAYISGEHARVDSFMNDLMSRLSNSYTIGFQVEPEEQPKPRRIELKVRDQRVEVTHRRTLFY